MKVSELLVESKQLSFPALQKVIYDFVLKKMKLPAAVKSDASHEVKDDRFWTSYFDRVLKYAEQENIDKLEDAILDAVVDVSAKIVDHYGDAMNHAPGYKPVKLEELDDGSVSRKDFADMIELMLPGYKEKEKSAKREAKKVADAKYKKKMAEITPDALKQVATALNTINSGFDIWTTWLKSDDLEELTYNLATIDELKKIKSGNDAKALFKKKASPEKFFNIVIDNLEMADKKPAGIREVLSQLSYIRTNKKLTKELFDLIK